MLRSCPSFSVSILFPVVCSITTVVYQGLFTLTVYFPCCCLLSKLILFFPYRYSYYKSMPPPDTHFPTLYKKIQPFPVVLNCKLHCALFVQQLLELMCTLPSCPSRGARGALGYTECTGVYHIQGLEEISDPSVHPNVHYQKHYLPQRNFED